VPAGWDSAVGVATRSMEGPGIESQWWAKFPAPVKTGTGAHPASDTMGTWLFPEGVGVKAAKAWCWPPTPSSAEVKETVELYNYSLDLYGLF
jgi:hypothetical protein